MELKSRNKHVLTSSFIVLIEPLWNWNTFSYFFKSIKKCINRTFMELKFMSKKKGKGGGRSINRTFMELKSCTDKPKRYLDYVLIEPLWNWN